MKTIYKKLVEIKLSYKEDRYCCKTMSISNDKSSIDKKIWKYSSINPRHDKTISLRFDSIFKGLKIPLYILYFITFECFAFKKGLNQTFWDTKDLCTQINKMDNSKYYK